MHLFYFYFSKSFLGSRQEGTRTTQWTAKPLSQHILHHMILSWFYFAVCLLCWGLFFHHHGVCVQFLFLVGDTHNGWEKICSKRRIWHVALKCSVDRWKWQDTRSKEEQTLQDWWLREGIIKATAAWVDQPTTVRNGEWSENQWTPGTTLGSLIWGVTAGVWSLEHRATGPCIWRPCRVLTQWALSSPGTHPAALNTALNKVCIYVITEWDQC